MILKRLFTLLLSCMFFGALTACGTQGRVGANTSAKVDNTPAEIDIYSTSGMSPDQFKQLYGDPIQKKFPNYTVNYIQYQKQGGAFTDLINKGQNIDIYWDSISAFLNTNTQYSFGYDMSDLIQKHNVDLSQIEPTLMDGIRMISDGKIFGLPVLNTNYVLFYNKDVFDKFGVPYPKNGMTWDDIKSLSQKLTRLDNGTQYMGVGTDIIHFLIYNQVSAPYVDPKTGQATINSPEWTSKWKSVFDTISFTNNGLKTLPAHDDFYINKTLAMYIGSSNTVLDFNAFNGINFDMASFPVLSNAPGIGSQSYPIYFGIPSISQHKDQAMDVIKYLISPEFQTQFSKEGAMTVLKNTDIQNEFGQDTPYKDKNLKAIFYDKLAPIAPKTVYDNAAQKSYISYANQVALGQIDLNTAFTKIEDEVNKAVAAAKQQSTSK